MNPEIFWKPTFVDLEKTKGYFKNMMVAIIEFYMFFNGRSKVSDRSEVISFTIITLPKYCLSPNRQDSTQSINSSYIKARHTSACLMFSRVMTFKVSLSSNNKHDSWSILQVREEFIYPFKWFQDRLSRKFPQIRRARLDCG